MGKRATALRDKEEFDFFIALLLKRRGEKARDLAIMMSYWGLRINDFLQLKWDNVDMTNRVIRVTESKTNKIKTLFLNDTIVGILSKMRKKEPSAIYLFQSKMYGERKPISVKTVNRWLLDCEPELIEYRKKLGIYSMPSISSHTLRKTGARLRLKNGATIEAVQQFLNHASAETTVIYLDNDEYDLEKTMRLGDAIFC